MGFFEIAAIGALLLGAIWLIALLDLVLGRFDNGTTQLLWALIVLFVPLGFVIYLAFGRRQVRSGGIAFLHRP